MDVNYHEKTILAPRRQEEQEIVGRCAPKDKNSSRAEAQGRREQQEMIRALRAVLPFAVLCALSAIIAYPVALYRARQRVTLLLFVVLSASAPLREQFLQFPLMHPDI